MHTQKYLAETAEKQSVRAHAAAILQRTCKENKPRAQAQRRLKRGEIRKQAKTLISSRLWTAGKQVTSE